MSEVLSGRSPWLWLGSGIAMLVALGFGIFDDDDGFGDFEEFARTAQSGDSAPIDSELQDRIDDIIGSALSGNLDLDDYEPPDFASPFDREEIRVTTSFEVLATLSIQDMLDGEGYGSTSVGLTAEGGREREGILLEDLLDKAGAPEDWNTVVVTDFAGLFASVNRDAWEEDSEQYLLYWSSDDDPSPTLSFTDPGGFGGRLVDVVQITVVD